MTMVWLVGSGRPLCPACGTEIDEMERVLSADHLVLRTSPCGHDVTAEARWDDEANDVAIRLIATSV